MNKLAKNYLYTGGYQILNILIMLVTTPYLTRVLGSSCLGIDTYVLSIVQICEVMGSLGITIYGNREIAYVRGNRRQLNRVFWELFFLRMILGAGVCGIYLLIALRSRYRVVFLIQMITLVSYYLDISWLYIGLEDVKSVTLCSAFARIGAAALILTLVRGPEHLYLYVALSAASQALITVLLLAGCRSRISLNPFGASGRNSGIRIRRHLRPVIALFLPQAASSLYVIFDKTMLGLLASDVSRTSIYDKAEMIVKAPVVLAAALTTVLMPRIANYHANGMKDDIRNLVRRSLEVMFLLFAPVSAGMAIVARIFIPFYLGAGYTDSVRVVWILSPVILAIALSNVSGAQFLIGCNETGYLAASYLTSAVFNIVGNYFLIPRLDETGASITTLSAEWIVVAIQFLAMRKILGRIGILRIAYKKILAAALMCAVLIPLGKIGATLPVMFLQIVVGAAVYFLALALMRDNSLAYGIRMLRGSR
ncbi:MAG: flippase [Eubacteriales bacterium]|nr:flippase [Eubacteriales bacterium]